MHVGVLAQHARAPRDDLVERVHEVLVVVYESGTAVVASEAVTVKQVAAAAGKGIGVIGTPGYEHRPFRLQFGVFAEQVVLDSLPTVVAEGLAVLRHVGRSLDVEQLEPGIVQQVANQIAGVLEAVLLDGKYLF